MELPHLGKSCFKAGCREHNEYLPLKCIFCNSQFCQQHYRGSSKPIENGHQCPRFPVDARAIECPLCKQIIPTKNSDIDASIDEHITKGCPKPAKIYQSGCEVDGCGKRELMVIKCKLCDGCFCIKHRLERDHACKPKSSNVTKLRKSLKDGDRGKNGKSGRGDSNCAVS